MYDPPVFNLYKKSTITATANGTATTSIGKYLIRGDSRGCISLWNLNHPQNQMEGIKKSNYEMSLAKFWSENFKTDSENVKKMS
jgi:hypothetical protein